MRGTIQSNLGDSRYIVSYEYAQTLLDAEIERLDADYTEIEQRLTDAQAALSEVHDAYLARVAAIDAAITAYQDCVDNFSRAACLIDEEAKCNATYFDCEADCSEDHPAGDPEYWPCLAECEAEQDRCLGEIESICQQAQIDHNADCSDKWSGDIYAAQAEAAQAEAKVQARLYEVRRLEAQKLSLAKRLTELRQVGGVTEQATVFTAQYTDDLDAGDDVEVAITPAGRTVITDSAAAWSEVSAGLDQCINDARSLPAGNVFVNAALATGAETWHPTWRTGTVQEVGADTLTVEVHPGILYGTLGTRVSEKNINCTPPQILFDGGSTDAWAAAVEAAHTALIEAQQAKLDAYAELQECLDTYDGDWFTDCYNAAAVVCANNCGTIYLACIDGGTDPEVCETQRQACLSQCLLDAAADCDAQQEAHQQGCRDTYQPAIDAADAAVQAAETDYANALRYVYNPADPLVLELPVAHCSADSYEVDDEVLIDFQVRQATRENPMAVWESARVVGWASLPRLCINALGFIWSDSYILDPGQLGHAIFQYSKLKKFGLYSGEALYSEDFFIMYDYPGRNGDDGYHQTVIDGVPGSICWRNKAQVGIGDAVLVQVDETNIGAIGGIVAAAVKYDSSRRCHDVLFAQKDLPRNIRLWWCPGDFSRDKKELATISIPSSEEEISDLDDVWFNADLTRLYFRIADSHPDGWEFNELHNNFEVKGENGLAFDIDLDLLISAAYACEIVHEECLEEANAIENEQQQNQQIEACDAAFEECLGSQTAPQYTFYVHQSAPTTGGVEEVIEGDDKITGILTTRTFSGPYVLYKGKTENQDPVYENLTLNVTYVHYFQDYYYDFTITEREQTTEIGEASHHYKSYYKSTSQPYSQYYEEEGDANYVMISGFNEGWVVGSQNGEGDFVVDASGLRVTPPPNAVGSFPGRPYQEGVFYDEIGVKINKVFPLKKGPRFGPTYIMSFLVNGEEDGSYTREYYMQYTPTESNDNYWFTIKDHDSSFCEINNQDATSAGLLCPTTLLSEIDKVFIITHEFSL